MQSISIDGQTLHGVDRLGVWVTHSLEGWHAPGPTDHGFSTGVGARAAFPGLPTAQPRQITVTGRVSCRDEATAQQARHVLVGLLQRPGRMTVSSRGETSYREVRALELEDPVIRGRLVLWQLTVTALDPRRYGGWQEQVEAGQASAVQVFHRGNAPSYPVISLRGDAPLGYTITNETTGTTFEVFAALPAGVEHVVDMSTGRAYQGGAPVARYGAAQLVTIEPGPPQWVRFRIKGATGTVAGSVSVQDTWI